MEKRKKEEWEKRERGWPKGPTGRFPPKGRKNRLKYSTGSVGGRASNEEEILKKNLLRVSQLGGRKTRSHSREGQFKSSLSPGFLFFPANEPHSARNNAMPIKQWNRAIASRSNVEIERSKPRCFAYSSSYAWMRDRRRCEDRGLKSIEYIFFFETQIFFLFLLFKSLLICWGRNDDNRIGGSKKSTLDLKENWKEEDILDSTWRKLELLLWWIITQNVSCGITIYVISEWK